MRLGFVRSSFVRKKKPLSSLMKTGCQSEKLTRTSSDEEMRAAAESVLKTEKVIGVKWAAYGTLQPEVESAFQVLIVVMSRYCLVKDTILNERKYLFERKTRYALHKSVELVLADAPYCARSTSGLVSSAREALCTERT